MKLIKIMLKLQQTPAIVTKSAIHKSGCKALSYDKTSKDCKLYSAAILADNLENEASTDFYLNQHFSKKVRNYYGGDHENEIRGQTVQDCYSRTKGIRDENTNNQATAFIYDKNQMRCMPQITPEIDFNKSYAENPTRTLLILLNILKFMTLANKFYFRIAMAHTLDLVVSETL